MPKKRSNRKVKISPARKKKQEINQDLDDFFRNFTPGVAYFIAYTRTTECNSDSISALLHYLDNDVELKTIDSRIKGGEEDDILTEKMVRELFQVVKNHDNDSVKSLVRESNRFCYGSKLVEKLDGWSEEEIRIAFGRIEPRPPMSRRLRFCDPVRIVLVKEEVYRDKVTAVVRQLRSDGMCLFIDTIDKPENPSPSLAEENTCKLMKAVGDINGVMANLSNPHVLCRGKVYAKPDAAQFTFVPMMDTATYLNKLLANSTIRDSILKNIEKLVKLMSNPACELFPQLKLDLDLIEVLNGKSLKIRRENLFLHPCRRMIFAKKISKNVYII